MNTWWLYHNDDDNNIVIHLLNTLVKGQTLVSTLCYYSYDDLQQPRKLKLLQSLFQMKAGIACLRSQRSKQWKWEPRPVLSSEPELIMVSLACLSLWHCSCLLHLIFIICCIQRPDWFIVLDPYKPASLFILFVENSICLSRGREWRRESMFVPHQPLKVKRCLGYRHCSHTSLMEKGKQWKNKTS